MEWHGRASRRVRSWLRTGARLHCRSTFRDGNLYQTRTPADLPSGRRWVFDHPFFLLLNVAVGGTWPGSPDGSTVFPQKMLVDYVRVYERNP